MRVLYVTAEVYPLVKTGGLADVSGALPQALIARGLDVRLLVPGLPAILEGLSDVKPVMAFRSVFGTGTATLRRGHIPESGVTAYVIDAPDLYDRPGNPYLGPDGHDWPDNHRRFALLGWMAARITSGQADSRWQPDIVHGHDWHAGLAPAYVAAQPKRRAGTVFTVHNLAYQGLFPHAVYWELDLPGHFFAVDGVEFYGNVSFMKAGLVYGDRITTVSPTYAREIRRPDMGHGLHGVIDHRAADLTGILNGVDYSVWDPGSDSALPTLYARDSLVGKVACKAALQSELGLSLKPRAPLFVVVSRLTAQKGLDLVLPVISGIVHLGGQLAVLGSGDADIERHFQEAAAAHPGSVALRIGFNEGLSHRVIGGADVIVVPSRFEPCGLTQMYGLRYGALPLVRRVGGLADTVVDATEANVVQDVATGFVFDDATPAGLSAAIDRAVAIYGNASLWTQLMRRAMAQNFSWDASAQKYVEVYRQAKARTLHLAQSA